MNFDAPQPGRPASPGPSPAGAPAGGVPIAPGVHVPESALRFSYARSSGPGGQNVNKLSTKAELRIALADLPLSVRVLGRLRDGAGRRITAEGDLQIVCEEHRSQVRNRDECMDRLRELILQAKVEPKVRRKTRPSRGSVERRLAGKKGRSDIKRGRSRGTADD